MRSLIDRARNSGQQTSGILYLTSRREDSVSATAIPLKNSAGNVLAVLTVAISRSGLVAEQQQIRAIAYGVASGGILLAIVFSLWIAARVSRPVEELARAAEEVASGSWDTQVPERGRDEVGSAGAQLQSHDGAADEPARAAGAERTRGGMARTGARLAHELKNPLFPLQLTVENLVRARQLPRGGIRRSLQREHADAEHGDRQSEEDHRAIQRLQQNAETGAGADRRKRCGERVCDRCMRREQRTDRRSNVVDDAR